MRHLMSPLDFTVEELDNLMDLAQDIEKNPKKYAHACDGKKLATLFFEPSTRTRLSHEAASLISEAVFLVFLLPIPVLQQKGKLLQIRFVCFLLCGYLCNETSERRSCAGSQRAFQNPCHQCRRRRTSASDTDPDRSAYDPFFKRSS